MKKLCNMGIRLVLFLLFFTTGLLAQPDKRLVKLSGKMMDKFQISMVLSIKNDTVFGYYFNESPKKKVPLIGLIIGSKIMLNEEPYEFEGSDEISKGFIGEIKGNSISGNWVDKFKNETIRFNVFVNSDRIIVAANGKNKIEGIYSNYPYPENASGFVQLYHIDENIFAFGISFNSNYCMGRLINIVELTNLKSSVFSSEDCERITFTLTNNLLNIDEQSCLGSHGASCSFGGNYKLIK